MIIFILDFETEDTESAVESLEGGGTLWREERQRAQENHFLQEIQNRNSCSLSGRSDDNAIQEEDDQELYENDRRVRKFFFLFGSNNLVKTIKC